MRLQIVAISLAVSIMFLSSCGDKKAKTTKECFTQEIENISKELILKNDTDLKYWTVQEIPGRSSLIIHEGEVGERAKAYEIFKENREEMIKEISAICSTKLSEGYREITVDDYSTLIIQIDTSRLHENFKEDSIVYFQESFNLILQESGNGMCSSYDLNQHSLNFFGSVISAEKAAFALTSLFHEYGIKIDPIIAIEKGGEVSVLYPKDFEGDFQYH